MLRANDRPLHHPTGHDLGLPSSNRSAVDRSVYRGRNVDSNKVKTHNDLSKKLSKIILISFILF